MRTAKILLITFFILSLVSCAPESTYTNEVISVAEEINQCKPGDTLIIKDHWVKQIHAQDIGIYHGGPIANDEHLAIYGK
jgi:hypothetical protein